jgi:hypothetical protein
MALHACVRTLPLLPGPHDEVEQELRVSIELVRAAIDQLQLVPSGASGFAPGFVARERRGD